MLALPCILYVPMFDSLFLVPLSPKKVVLVLDEVLFRVLETLIL